MFVVTLRRVTGEGVGLGLGAGDGYRDRQKAENDFALKGPILW